MPVIAVIPGDGIGNEVIPEAVKVLETLHEVTGMDFEYQLL
jgi:isocitrate/isopropylmalate dehydrogenase